MASDTKLSDRTIALRRAYSLCKFQKEDMSATDFDIENVDHLKAVAYLSVNGAWPNDGVHYGDPLLIKSYLFYALLDEVIVRREQRIRNPGCPEADLLGQVAARLIAQRWTFRFLSVTQTPHLRVDLRIKTGPAVAFVTIEKGNYLVDIFDLVDDRFGQEIGSRLAMSQVATDQEAYDFLNEFCSRP